MAELRTLKRKCADAAYGACPKHIISWLVHVHIMSRWRDLLLRASTVCSHDSAASALTAIALRTNEASDSHIDESMPQKSPQSCAVKALELTQQLTFHIMPGSVLAGLQQQLLTSMSKISTTMMLVPWHHTSLYLEIAALHHEHFLDNLTDLCTSAGAPE